MENSSSPTPDSRLDELSEKIFESGLTDAEHIELMRLLAADVKLRERFLEWTALHALLREGASSGVCNTLSAHLFGVRTDELTELTERLKSAGWEDTAKPVPLPPVETRRTNTRRWMLRPAFAFGAALLVVMAVYEAWLRPQAARWFDSGPVVATSRMDAKSDLIAPTSIAKLTYLNGCSWGGGSPQFTSLDNQVRPGDEIALHEGIAEFQLASGVSLSIEGPATLVLTSPTSLMLQHGRMTVYVPPDVTNFRLMAAGCRITGTGSEFGVQVAGGKIDVHAFTGKIQAAPVLTDEQVPNAEGVYAIARKEDLTPSSSFSPTTIEAGRGLTLTTSSDDTIVSQWHDADETQFATKLSMAGKLPITKAYVSAIKKSQPIGYWRFEKAQGGLVANEIAGLAELKISGDVNFVGDKNNYALELGRPGSTGILVCKNELNLPRGSDYSVELWMKPSHYHFGGLVGMVFPQQTDKKDFGAFCLLTARVGASQQCLRFLHRDPPGFDPKTGTNCYSTVPYRLRRWQHVAAVKRGPDMEIYLDGNLVGTERDESSLSQHLCLFVGGASVSCSVYPFIGQLDELAIYGKALEPEEIKQRINAVKWDTGRRGEVRVNGI